MKPFTLFLVLLLLPANQVGLCGQSASGGITIRELRCEYAKNPLGIDTPQPRFSWILESKQRAQAKLENITRVINNLLDNITETNRDHVDRRLNELTTEKQQIEARLEELERLSLSQAEIDTIVNEGMQFLSGLEFTLHNGLPHEKLTALRQCVEKIGINKPTGEITLAIRTVPGGNLRTTQELRISV